MGVRDRHCSTLVRAAHLIMQHAGWRPAQEALFHVYGDPLCRPRQTPLFRTGIRSALHEDDTDWWPAIIYRPLEYITKSKRAHASYLVPALLAHIKVEKLGDSCVLID